MTQSYKFEYQGATLGAEPLTDAILPTRVVYLHGWGQSRESMRLLATSLVEGGESWLIDLPGFGETPPLAGKLTPEGYAQVVEAWLRTQAPLPTIIVGHSFGFHVALRLAHAQTSGAQPLNIRGLVSLAGAGVRKPVTVQKAVRKGYVKLLLKFARLLQPFVGEGVLNALRSRFGSRDYLAAGESMRPTFVAVVNDDMTPLCPTITMPTLLLYGTEDTETPPQLAEAFKKALPNATLVMLPHQNHYSLLQGGRHVVAQHIRQFLKGL